MTTVQTEPQGKGPYLPWPWEKAGIEETWRGVVIFTLDSGLGWPDEAKGSFCKWCSEGGFRWGRGGSDENRKGVADRGAVLGRTGLGVGPGRLGCLLCMAHLGGGGPRAMGH